MTPLHIRIEQIQPKLHGMAVGMTLGIGSLFLNQGCPMIGQCPSCGGACVPQLSLLALPLMADGVVMISSKVLKKNVQQKE